MSEKDLVHSAIDEAHKIGAALEHTFHMKPIRGNPMLVFGLIFLAVCINVTAQMLLKAGMQRIGHFDFYLENVLPVGMKVVSSLPIFLGLCCYVASVVVWMMVLSRADVSLAYPLSSLGYVLATVVAAVMFKEHVTLMRVTGIGVIIMGVFLISQTA